jgi:hypothetical protein
VGISIGSREVPGTKVCDKKQQQHNNNNNNNNNLLQEPAKLLRQPSITSQYSIMRASLYSTPKVDSSSNER